MLKGGLARLRRPEDFEAQLEREGMPGELEPLDPAIAPDLAQQDVRSGRSVRLPHDWTPEGHRSPSTADRVLQRAVLQGAADVYFTQLAEYFWRRASWRAFPAWHRRALELHLETGHGASMLARWLGYSRSAVDKVLARHRQLAGVNR